MSLLRKKLFLKFFLIAFILTWITGIANFFLPHRYAWLMVVVLGVTLVLIFSWLVTRPFNKILKEFKALLTGKRYNRIYTKKRDEIGVIAHFFNEITHSLERVSTDIKDHRRISSELNVAQKIQRDLIPQTMPEIPGLDIIAKTKPAAEIGGDSFDFITKDAQSYMYIGDVTGHGVPSGLVMMIVDTLIHSFVDTSNNAHQLMTNVNKYLKPRIQSTMFMTMMMLRWEHQTQELFYTGAGHETIMHYKAADNSCVSMKGGGIALGMVPDNSKLIKETKLEVTQGDFVVLYTDGIVEARNENGEMFGFDRLTELIQKQAPKAKTAEELFQRISKEVLHFLGDFIQEDDMTLLVIKIGEKAAAAEGEKTEKSTQWETGTEQVSLIDYTQGSVEESGLKEQS